MKPMLFVASLTFALSFFARAEEPPKTWAHESEIASVVTSGNTSSESISAKQKTSYTLDANIFTLTGRYLRNTTDSTETARSWDAGVRYERSLNDNWAAFLGHSAESNTYAGYIQRNSTDLGGKYFFIKEKETNLFSEAGARYTNLYNGENSYATFGRLYVEYAQAWSESVSTKLWVEYLPNFKESNAYLANTEVSLTSVLSSVFSLKVAYLAKYQNVAPSFTKGTVTTDGKRLDSIFTTSLVAKF